MDQQLWWNYTSINGLFWVVRRTFRLLMKGQRQAGLWARWLSWRWIDCVRRTSVSTARLFHVDSVLFFFHPRSWKQRVCFSFVKGSFLSLQSEFLTCGDQTLRPAAPRVQKLPKVIIEVVRRGRCLHFHFTVPTCSMNEQPPGSRDWTTSSPRTSLPLAFFQSKCVHSAYFSADRELMQLGGVPENAERAGVIIPQGLLTLMFESRTGIFCFLLPFTVKREKKGVKLRHVEDRFSLFTEALGFMRILP